MSKTNRFKVWHANTLSFTATSLYLLSFCSLLLYFTAFQGQHPYSDWGIWWNLYTVSFSFMHGNVGGNYMCFVWELEASQTGRCTATPQQQACQPMQTISMTGLQPGGWFSCGIRCSLGSVQHRISQLFPTPAVSGDCCPYLINDGASFADYNNGSANVTFEWASTGTFTGFQCMQG